MQKWQHCKPMCNFWPETQNVATTFGFFTNTQNWQCWHYCQLCIPTYFQFSSLFAPYDVSKCDTRYQWIQTDYISILKTLLFLFISNGRAKTKLAILAFLYCEEFVKNPNEMSKTVFRESVVRTCNTIKSKPLTVRLFFCVNIIL